MDGILIIDKEKGYTSHDVVARLRGILHQKKIGHTGTLDPDATGVLPVCLGRATKVCDMLTDSDKCYEAVMLLGKETDTQDMSGTVLREQEPQVTEEEVRRAVLSFVGEYLQIPPMYSALKVGGQKLVDLARAGKEVERKPRPVTIRSIEICGMALPRVTMRVTCSKGTYIRTLCHDVGQKLGCGAAMESLRRLKAAGYTETQAMRLDEVESRMKEGSLEEVLIPLEQVFSGLPRFTVKPEWEKLLRNGNPLRIGNGTMEGDPAGQIAVYFSNGEFAAVYGAPDSQGRMSPRKMFLPY